MRAAGIIDEPDISQEPDFNPGKPRRQSLLEQFNSYDLSDPEDHEQDDEDHETDEDDNDERHIHRLAKTMQIRLDGDEKALGAFDIVKHRTQKFADFLGTIEDQSNRIINDPWDDYPAAWDSRQSLNRLEGQVGDAIHLIIRLEPDKLDDIIGYLNDCSHEPAPLGNAARRLMSPGTRGNNRGLAYHILRREKIKRAPASGVVVDDNEPPVSEAFVRSRVRMSMIDKINE